ncbi:hypothetical protein CPB97_000365 [Podila verticillata]|nr:hypothetical protein CPB97_000365 [Podila verticillata]
MPRCGFDFAKVKFSANKVTIKAGQTTKVKVQFSQPATGPGLSPHPYAGVKSDIAKVPIVDSSWGSPIFQLNNVVGSSGQKG